MAFLSEEVIYSDPDLVVEALYQLRNSVCSASYYLSLCPEPTVHTPVVTFYTLSGTSLKLPAQLYPFGVAL